MKFLALAIALALLPAAVHADQYDAVLQYANAAAAKADLAAHYDAISDAFLADRVESIQVWRASQDTTDGQGNVVHNYLAGFFVLVSASRLILSLRDDPNLQIVVNRDLCNERRSGCVVKSNINVAILQDIRFSPVFMGSDIPFGGLR